MDLTLNDFYPVIDFLRSKDICSKKVEKALKAYADNSIILEYGRYKGKKLTMLRLFDKEYYNWYIKQEFFKTHKGYAENVGNKI